MPEKCLLNKQIEPSVSVKARASNNPAPNGADAPLGEAYIGAASAINAGLRIIPLDSKSKKPSLRGWQERAIKTLEELRSYTLAQPDTNFGILTGDVVVVDIDGEKGKKRLAKLEKKYGKRPRTWTVKTPGGGLHIYFQHSEGGIGNSAGKLAPNIDTRGKGGLVVCAGSVHPNGGRYEWEIGPGDVEIAPLPKWLRKKLRKLKIPHAPPTEAWIPLDAHLRERAKVYCERALELEVARVRKAPPGIRNDTLNLASFQIGQLIPFGVLDESVAKAALELAGAACDEQPKVQATVASGLEAGRGKPRKSPFEAPTEEYGSLGGRTLTQELARLGEDDIANAERFVRRMQGEVCWTSGRGWMVYDGTRWKEDAAEVRITLAAKVMKAIKREAQYLRGEDARDRRYKFAKQSRHKSAIDRMLQIAKPELVVLDENFDADNFLLNVQNGTLDLRTGCLAKHDPSDYLSQLCPVSFDPNAKANLFKKFLRAALGGNKSEIRFMQKAFGYSLTGDVSEHILFFIYGPGRTGKSTIANLLRDTVGDYGVHTPSKTLLVKQYDNDIPVDIARLKGARVVTAIEANANQQLDEAKIKSMTGGDKQVGRFMRQNLFEFMPAFKLWFMANDMPRVRATDDAIWARLIVIGFKNQVPDDQQDKRLPEKLRAEKEGILAWAVRGCLKWQKEGLADKTIFDLEKDRWRMQSDTVGRFFGECCQVASSDETVQAGVLFARYEQWCRDNAEKPSSTSVFKARLIELNISPGRTKKTRFWKGIRLIS